ncbi:hypothetical protein Lfu02_48840 [Longispora fulva]|uniref:Uncharacterized protein n=1 Tax=Longispora fulva TaxID=619741 RepID=A0A8J7GMF3_9ACTN|nr:hypothetical protein [Longispora fulva]MBG6138260.1 hypothetical protein [Longispora fulva]GIG60512.1 hypothetical protein Lfu02_48840 [Longispora fulva]
MSPSWRRALPAVAVAAVLSVGYLLAPPLGTDLSAQVARADFFAAHGFTPIDFRWYGGVDQFGYSLVSPALMGAVGPRTLGILSLLTAALAFAALLARAGVRRPVLGGVVGALCVAGNLASGRVTYGLGVAFGLLALLALTAPDRRVRYGGAALAGLLAGLTSPVAGLFVGLAGAALLLSAAVPPSPRTGAARTSTPSRTGAGQTSTPAGTGAARTPPTPFPTAAARSTALRGGAVLAGVGALGLALTGLLFGEGGVMNISAKDTRGAVIASLLVAVFAAHRPVRVGALLSAAGVFAAYLVPTPVGLNATRLAVMFALPVLAATARLPHWSTRARSTQPSTASWRGAPAFLRAALALAVAAAIWLLAPPVVLADLRDAGNPANERSFYTPLTEALGTQHATRTEVVPTRNYWEAAYVAPLARGWLRQLDLERNPLLYENLPAGTKLTADNYRAWLRDNAVSHVAVSDAEPSWLARPEAALIRSGLPYLTEVWHDAHWRLYAVADPTPVVPGLVGQDAVSVTFAAEAPGSRVVRVRYSRWLRMPGGRLTPGPGGWTTAEVPGPGLFRVSS